MSLTLNLLQVSEEGKNQAVCRKLHVCVQFYPWFKFYFLLFLGMVMYDIDMIMSLKQKKITGICRIHFGLADCRSIGRTCITWPEFPAETIAANRKQKSATRMVPKAVGGPPLIFRPKKKNLFGDHPLLLSKGLDDWAPTPRDWSPTCHSVNPQKSQSQGSHCSSNFCRTWWPDKNCSHCTPVSKWKWRSVNGLTSGTWNIFSILFSH